MRWKMKKQGFFLPVNESTFLKVLLFGILCLIGIFWGIGKGKGLPAYWILFCIPILFGLAFVFARWIDRPISKLMDSAIQIGRGDFSIRLPVQKNPGIQRLARLINYMVEEMDHLQRINVSAIINEKNKTEQTLRNIPDGVVVVDSQGNVTLVNTTAEKWFGKKENQVLHQPIQVFSKNATFLQLVRSLISEKRIASAEFWIRSGEEVPQKRILLAMGSPIMGSDGRLIGVVLIIRDVTKEKEADRIKTELVSMVAHEIKSPLTSMYGFTELLLENPLPEAKAREYIRVIQSEVIRLTDFVNKFLSLSRLESGKIRVRMDPFDLSAVIEKAIRLSKPAADKKHIVLSLKLPESMPFVVGDPELIEQVFLNLLSNAIKYSPKQSKVGIEIDSGENELTVHVIDNGYGIPKEALPRIFEKFYRVSEIRNDEEIEGSGLGLALVKEILEKHGSEIKVKSKLGVGSVFTFSLRKANIVMSAV